MAEDFRAMLVDRGVPGDVAERLAVHLGLLVRWNRTHNLVRYGRPRELVDRHVMESLAGAGHLEGDGRLLVDVGSGAGFPGVPLLAARPSWRGVLIEPRAKRWAFLKAVVRELGLSAEVVDRRFEAAGIVEGSVDVVVSRAMGRQRELLDWAESRLTRGGKVVLWVGVEEAERLTAYPGWRVVTSPLPGLERGRLACCTPCFT